MSGFPYGLPSAESWTVRGYRWLTEDTAPAAGGTCRLEFDQLAGDVMWFVNAAVCSSTSTQQSSLRIYSGGESVGRLITGTDAGNFCEADYTSPGRLVEPGSMLVAVWSGASAGSVGTLNVQVTELQRVVA